MGYADDYPDDNEVVLERPAQGQTFDPRTLGCRCDVCPLGQRLRRDFTWVPVPPERRKREGRLGRITALSTFPGGGETMLLRPLIGPAGQRWMQAMGAQRVPREEVTITNLLLCRPPGDDLRSFTAEVRREWKREIKRWKRAGSRGDAPAEPLDPMEACAPHLWGILWTETDHLLPMGSEAANAMLNANKSIDKLRGGFYEVILVRDPSGKVATFRRGEATEHLLTSGYEARVVKVAPTISPAQPIHDPTYNRVLWRDIDRAARWWTNSLRWPIENRLLSTYPSAALVADFLSRPGPFAFDIETTKNGPLHSTLRCVGIYDMGTSEGLVIPWESLDGKVGLYPGERRYGWRLMEHGEGEYMEGHYSPADASTIVTSLRNWLTGRMWGRPVELVGHNAILFDLSILERVLGLLHEPEYLAHPDPIFVYDGIFLARCEDSELDRSLYLRGTLEVDVPDWKGGGEEDEDIRVSPRTYDQLATYNHTDNLVTAETAKRLWPRVVNRRQAEVFDFDRRAARVAREMTHLGLRVNQSVRERLEREYVEKIKVSREKIAKLVGRVEFNPASTLQLGELLYEEMGLPIVRYTDTHAPSTDDDTLRDLMQHTSGDQRELLAAIRHDRQLNKMLGTSILPLRPWNDLREGSSGKLVGGLVGPDGRVHPQYPIFVPATGRFSSKNPNSQNYPASLRVMFEPEDGHVYLMADFDQIELRLFAALAGVRGYLDVFDQGGDPHAITAILIYQEAFRKELLAGMTPEQRERYERTKVPDKVKGSKKYNLLRTFAKTFVYCVIYGGTDDTVYLSVSSATDPETGALLFPDMTRREVTAAYNAFLRNAPEITGYWRKLEQFGQENRFITEPVMGRRRDFPEYDRNGILNHPIQGAAAVIATRGLLSLRDYFIPDFTRRTGIVNQMHDAYTIEVPEAVAVEAKAAMEERVNMRFDQVPGMLFSAEADVCVNWRAKEKSDFWKPPVG